MALPSGQITQGDSQEWTLTDSRLSTYTTPGATLYLSDNINAPTSLSGEIAANVATFTLTPAASAALPAGKLSWYAVVNDGSDARVTVGSGSVQVLADPSATPATSWVRTQLTAVETAISNLLSNAPGLQSVSYLGVSYTKDNINDLYAIRNKLKAELADETALATGGTRGGGFTFRPVSLKR